MKPANSIHGRTSSDSFADPFTAKSTKFIASSIESIEIKDIPNATFTADFQGICLAKIILSRPIDVRIPLIIASAKIALDGHGIPITWKKTMVPRSPIEQPARHQRVFTAERRQVWRHFQKTLNFLSLIIIINNQIDFREIKPPE